MGEKGELPLLGGFTNAGRVMRLGDTVRRPSRSTTPATRALLEHLERVGFDGAPRFLGIDERGREMLSFVPGAAAVEPLPPWALSDEALVSVAELLRRYHDAVPTFDPMPYAWPHPVPAAFRGGLVTHNDPNLDNIVFVGQRAVALIDFDLASPACAAWDVACAARLWAPLRAEEDVPEPLRGRTIARLRLFVDAYAMPRHERSRVVDAMVHTHDWCYRVVRLAIAAGHRPFAQMWHAGGARRTQRTSEWIAEHRVEMHRALVAP
jgi:phosphotransferase family enzyme